MTTEAYADTEYWEKRWEEGRTRWHRDYVENILKNHCDFLTAGGGKCSIFVPLCGKTLDMKWLAEEGHTVVGVDIVDLSAQQFFTENDIPFKKHSIEDFSVYEATDDAIKIKFFVGDVFKISAECFDAVWDCNALVAINPQDREKYIQKIDSLLKPSGRILLTTYEYDKTLRNAHPFSMPPGDIEALFSSFNVQTAETIDETERFKTNFNLPWAKRHVFHITRKQQTS
ncbi:PREDICTED: probable thiopurine S-methyltransferase [Amphimedon queenslandica]|uniref:thiopurine S-methyltransferase n=1 Tax=Amphimedon queenslandica TaxID=400682 RepID=A0A1X7VT27_AMPQE|nr:PREDICTED: probable thiopurine S-methyltransferase [Amphimedon queenslandica]|eukprot:XP_003382923.1 PREDICTED: probable thiopurine S-methyltransferase [Amphimedon queenslandica]